MRLTSLELTGEVMALARCLLVDNPSYVDGVFALKAAYASQFHNNGVPLDQWIGAITNGQPTYFFYGHGGEGRYRRDLPPGVDPATVPQVVLDPDARPAIALLGEMQALLDGLAAGRVQKIAGTDEPLDLADTEDVARVLPALRDILAVVAEASDPSYNRCWAGDAAARLRDPALLGPALLGPGGTAALDGLLGEITAEIELRRRACGADSLLASWPLVLRDACHGVGRAVQAAEGDVRGRAEFARCVSLAAADTAAHPDQRTVNLIIALARRGYAHVAASLADGYLTAGETLVEQALAAPTEDEFGGALFTAGLFFVAAYLVYTAISGPNPVSDARKQVAFWFHAAGVAEEKRVRVNTSCVGIVENRTGERLRRHQAEVAQARASGGDEAARQKVFDLIESQFFYPRFMEGRLLGEPRPPVR